MPEGPEILYTALLLKKTLKGYKLAEINSYTDKPAIVPKDLTGKIEEIDCYGKLFWIKVSGKSQSYYIDIHYGITGWLMFDKPEKNIKFDFKFTKGNDEFMLYMEDRRRFSKVKVDTQEQHDALINKMGVDILSKDFTEEYFKEIVSNKKTMIAAILLKQEYFAGLGNYIKNEAMYWSNLKIKSKTDELDEEDIKNLYNNILFVSYSNLMELLRDDHLVRMLDDNRKENMPEKLEVPYIYQVYGREKTPEGQKVYKYKVAGRDSYCIKSLC